MVGFIGYRVVGRCRCADGIDDLCESVRVIAQLLDLGVRITLRRVCVCMRCVASGVFPERAIIAPKEQPANRQKGRFTGACGRVSNVAQARQKVDDDAEAGSLLAGRFHLMPVCVRTPVYGRCASFFLARIFGG